MNKRILIIGPFPNPITGLSIANQTVYEGLQKKGMKVFKINSEYNKSIAGNTGTLSIAKFKFIKVYLELYKLFYSNIVYITIGQTFFGVVKYLPFLILKSILRKKAIVHLHGGDLFNCYKSQKKIKRKLMLFTLKLFNNGIVLSESLRSNLDFFLLPEHISVIPNCYSSRLSLGYSKTYRKLKIVFLGNLIEGKGINILLKSLIDLNYENIYVKIAGNIPIENQSVLKLLEKTPNCSYLGVVIGKEKERLLNWGNVFCLPTFYYKGEGQPISIIEGMAAGNLILTTKHGGIPDICSDKNAIFVEKNNLEDLKNKITFLLENMHIIKEKGEHNRKYAIENFSEEKFIADMINVFENCTH